MRRPSQAFISYGMLSNDELLLRYGFVEEGNPADTFVFEDMAKLLESSSPEAAKSIGTRLSALKELGLVDKTGRWQGAVTRKGGSEDTLTGLRVLLASKDEARAGRFDAPLSAGTEAAVRATVSALCAIQLGSMGSSVEEDEAMLAAGGLSERGELAVRYRLEKKLILQQVADM